MPEGVELTSDKRFVRRARELTNIKAMVRLSTAATITRTAPR